MSAFRAWRRWEEEEEEERRGVAWGWPDGAATLDLGLDSVQAAPQCIKMDGIGLIFAHLKVKVKQKVQFILGFSLPSKAYPASHLISQNLSHLAVNLSE